VKAASEQLCYTFAKTSLKLRKSPLLYQVKPQLAINLCAEPWCCAQVLRSSLKGGWRGLSVTSI
jgi:hypothetical protein